jgi:hypothetical protein
MSSAFLNELEERFLRYVKIDITGAAVDWTDAI